MHQYRTHTCGALRAENKGQTVRLSGWIHRKRDHGNLLFVDLRDNYGITQCVLDTSSDCFPVLEKVRPESVVKIDGTVILREPSTINLLPEPPRSNLIRCALPFKSKSLMI